MKRSYVIAGVVTLSLVAAGGAALAHGKKGGMRDMGHMMLDFELMPRHVLMPPTVMATASFPAPRWPPQQSKGRKNSAPGRWQRWLNGWMPTRMAN